ncbi:TraR/DksA family transcriptional regulator [Aestuariirhabdus sp. LZHN29]|uniref:TraR/DksA family transcriptional regulator n=1 Tax=Aestuariirhabdus sp. LZHN29 TaxID=3417462 RepID=UPI003CEE96EF
MTILDLTTEQQHELRQSLLSQRDELTQQLHQGLDSSAIVELDQQAFGRVSRQDALLQQSMAKATVQQAEEQLRQVTRALARIESDDFGYCEQCEEPIGYARLRVRPEAPWCMACQSMSEQ